MKVGFRGPFVYKLEGEIDFKTFTRVYTEDSSQIYRIRFFQKGEPYRFWGLFPMDIHFFLPEEGGVIFLFGTDSLGRDLFSRTLAGGPGQSLRWTGRGSDQLCAGLSPGGHLRLFRRGDGHADPTRYRVRDHRPHDTAVDGAERGRARGWSPVKIYFSITIILSMIGWAGLARVVRGKLLELRESDFVIAAKVAGSTDMQIIVEHLLPGFMSYLIVHLTLAIPNMILGETALSFLGLGIRAPAVSWGTLLKDAQNVRSVAVQPWMLIPGLLVIVTVLLFNFIGDGLRDAADPYK